MRIHGVEGRFIGNLQRCRYTVDREVDRSVLVEQVETGLDAKDD